MPAYLDDNLWGAGRGVPAYLDDDLRGVAGVWPDDQRAVSLLHHLLQLPAEDVVARVPDVVAVADARHHALRVLRQHVAEGVRLAVATPRRDRTAAGRPGVGHSVVIN